ncbi:hypothetical protein GCM10009714_25770 [Microlunatus capsulatus]
MWDVQAAHDAGIRVVAFTTGGIPRCQLEQVGRTRPDLVRAGLLQLAAGDATGGEGDDPDPRVVGRLDVPHGVADGDGPSGVEPVLLHRGGQQVGVRLGPLDVARGRRAVDQPVLDADGRQHPLQVLLAPAGGQHDGQPGARQLLHEVGRAVERDDLVLQGVVAGGVRLHDRVVVTAGEAAHQLLAADPDGLVAVGHRHALDAAVAHRLPPGQGVQVVGVQQGSVDVQQDAGAGCGHRGAPRGGGGQRGCWSRARSSTASQARQNAARP